MPSELAPWWLDRIVVPVFYTFFGASLGFGFGRLKDWLDARIARRTFLKAVRVELSTIHRHLEGTLRDTTEVKECLERGERRVLHLATTFQTAIYASQLGKLRDVSDPLLIDVIQFYDKLSNLERIKSRLISQSLDLTRLTENFDDALKEGPMVSLYSSGLDEVIKRINDLLPTAQSLVIGLPE
jgi:hypothetical protein